MTTNTTRTAATGAAGTDSTGLKPCPFCGGPAELRKTPNMYMVECENADCGSNPDVLQVFKHDAIAAWNRRATEQPSPATGGEPTIKESSIVAELDVEAERRDAVIEAARRLVKSKGRYHTELNYRHLAAALDELATRRAATGTPAKRAPDWISVEDRLPDDCTFVAIFDPENDGMPVRTAHWLAGSRTFESEQGWLAWDEVSHWMPLPPPPAQSQPAGSARQGGEHAPSKVDSPVGAKEQDK